MERRGEKFDYILLETTGLADPGNIAPVFWVDDGLGSTIYLDGIVTLVDAANLIRSLDQPLGDERVEEHDHPGPELSIAHLQISHADVILLNKADLVTPEQLRVIEERVRSINALARLYITDHSKLQQLEGTVLDLHAYDDVSTSDLSFAEKGHSHLDAAIGTVTLHLPVLDRTGLAKVDSWLQKVLWNSSIPGRDDLQGWEIHRSKGRLSLADGGVVMLQGVREIFELVESTPSNQASHDYDNPKIVFIGRHISLDDIAAGLQQSLNLHLSS